MIAPSAQLGRPAMALITAVLAVSISGCALIAGVEEGELAPGGNPHASGYAAEVLADGPIAYWRLGDPTTPTAVDATGNGHNGTYRGVDLGAAGAIVGDADTAVYFDGQQSEVDMGDKFGFEGRTRFSAEAWVNPDIEACSFLGKSFHDGSAYLGWFLYYQDTELTVRRGVNLAGPYPPLGQWTHVVVTYDGVTLVMYQNGQSVADRVVESDVPQHGGAFKIGRTDNWVAFRGILDEVALYDSHLAPDRILAHYEIGAGLR